MTEIRDWTVCAKRLLSEAEDVFFPRCCPFCGRLTGKLLCCEECRRSLPYLREPLCKRCGRPLSDEREEYCRFCVRGNPFFRRGKSIFRYEGAVRESILRMKFHNHREYLDFYAWQMAHCGARWLVKSRPERIVPVPMHPRKRRARGFDQCLLLARRLGELTGIPVDAGLVARREATLPQKGLDAAGRRKNVHGAFVLTRDHPAREQLLIVDDIFTTGATVNEVSRVLTAAGLPAPDVLTLSCDSL